MATGTVIPPGIDEEEEVVESGGTLSAIEEADRKSQVAIAKQYPRSITSFRNKLKEIAMMNQPVAMEMMYSLPRAGNQIVGPSVRFAEAVLSCWGNNRAGVEVIEINTGDDYVVAEGRFYDCEQNAGIAVRIRRRNVMRKKDADSYQVTGNAASSIALRNAILRGVPKALWADIFELAKQTAAGDVKSIEKVRGDLIKVFTALGVTEARLYSALGVQGPLDIGADEIVAMRSWHKQLVAKEVAIEDIFGSPVDDEIDRLMQTLGFNEAKKRMSRQAFPDKQAHLDYLRAEVQKTGGNPHPQPAQQPTVKEQFQAAVAHEEQPHPTQAGVAVEPNTTSAPETPTPASARTAPPKSSGKFDFSNF